MTCRVAAPDGVAYPARGVSCLPKYRTRRPQWHAELELPLRGGHLGADGLYRNHEAAQSTLELRVTDADVGVWGWLFHVAVRCLPPPFP